MQFLKKKLWEKMLSNRLVPIFVEMTKQFFKTFSFSCALFGFLQALNTLPLVFSTYKILRFKKKHVSG